MMKIESVDCLSVSKGRQQEYVLRVTTSEGDHDIVRTYGTFFDFKGKLAKSSGKEMPDLPGLTWFDRLKGGEKKKKQITDFCKAVLSLPEEISQGEDVHKFFEQWPSDSCTAAINNIKEEEKRKSADLNKEKSKLVKQSSNDLMMAELRKTMADGPTKRLSAGGAKVPDSPGKKRSVKGPLPETPPSTTKVPLERTKSEGDTEQQLSKYIVIADHTPQQDDEMALTKGDIVIVVEKLFLGWWLIQHNDTEGWGPAAKLQALDEQEDEEDLNDTTTETPEVCPVYEAISDFVARHEDEISYRKSQQVEVLKMQNDGWWKVRDKATGKVGMTPAVNLARLSDGSQSGDPVYSDISSYSHCNVYKKRTPPRRNSSHRMSLSELYATVEVKAKSKPLQKHISEGDEYDEDALYSLKDKPAVPPKKPGLSHLSYCEIEFSQEQQSGATKAQPPRFKIRESEDKVTYSDVEVPPVSPKPKGEPVHGKGKASTQDGYMNVVRTKPEPDKYCQLIQDYSPQNNHSEGMPASKDDIVKVTDDEATRAFCLMCLKEGEESKPCEGWIPKSHLVDVQVEVKGHSEHNIPIVSCAGDSDENQEENVYLTVLASQKEPKKPRWRKKDDRKADWFAGILSRSECETAMKDAKEGQFLVREKADEAEPFSISVFHEGGMKHFKILKKGENKYEVGGHCFKNLSQIIRHYTKYPLFKGNNDKEQKLGKPFIIPKQNGHSKKPKPDP